jgi:HK97 family phage prohead protease
MIHRFSATRPGRHPNFPRQSVPAAIRAVGEREFRFTAVTAKRGRDGHVLVPSGVDLANYKRNPVVLWQHGAANPVARCTGLSVIDRELRGSAEFPPAGTSELADEICGLVKQGIVSAVSVGFDVLESEPLDPKQPRGGQYITRSELLEISLVSVPADTGAMITERAYRRGGMISAVHTQHLIRASDAVDEASRHHHDLGRHMERGDERAAAASHRAIGRCLREAQRCLRAISAEGMDLDQEATSQAQNSDGLGFGTSGGHDYAPLLSRAERQAEALRLVGLVVMDGGAVGVAAIREAEFIRARAHIEAAARAGAFYREPSRAERQEQVRRLARPFG